MPKKLWLKEFQVVKNFKNVFVFDTIPDCNTQDEQTGTLFKGLMYRRRQNIMSPPCHLTGWRKPAVSLSMPFVWAVQPTVE